MTHYKAFAGRFFLHPVFVLAVIALPVNNLWLKSTGCCPLLAGKISDIAIMIFLPALICLGVAFVQYGGHTVESLMRKNENLHLSRSYHPSRRVIAAAVVVSGFLMVLLQISDTAAEVYDASLRFLNRVLLAGRVTAEPVKDLTDLVSLPFLAVPYVILNRGRPDRATGSG